MTGAPVAFWDLVSATARGASHVSGGLPNQDAHATTTLPDGTVVVAVADGHGGRGYVRSDKGSRLAVDCALEIVAAALAGKETGWTALRDFPVLLVRAWQTAVLDHLAANPLSEQESGRATAETLAQPLQLYGATLLVAALGRDGLWAAQIGDGDIIVASGGSCRSPVAGDDRLVGNATTSLCGPSAVGDFRVGVQRQLAPGDVVLLATDGYGNSFASDDWAPEVLGDLAHAIDRHGMEPIGRELPSWVAQSAAVGGDDTTVVLVSRRDVHPQLNDELAGMKTVVRRSDEDEMPAEAASQPAPPHPPAPSRDPGSRPERTRSRKVRVAAYLLGALALMAAGAGVTLRVLAPGETEPTSTPRPVAASPAEPTTGQVTPAEPASAPDRPCSVSLIRQAPAAPGAMRAVGSWSVACVPDESLDVYWFDPVASYWRHTDVEWRKGRLFVAGRKVASATSTVSSISGTTGP